MKGIILDCNPLWERIELMVNFTMPCNGGDIFVHCSISMTQTRGGGEGRSPDERGGDARRLA